MISFHHLVRAAAGLACLAMTACAGIARQGAETRAETAGETPTFHTVMAEIARTRGEPRIAALEYAAAARIDATFTPRAAQVAAESLQPSLALRAAADWLRMDPGSTEARHIAGQAALALDDIDRSAENYRVLLAGPPAGAGAEAGKAETELRAADNVFGARRLADRLGAYFPDSPAVLRLRGFAALRADDPAAAVQSFRAALAQAGPSGEVSAGASGGSPAATGASPVGAGQGDELAQALLRARVLAGDAGPPLAEAAARAQRDPTAANRLDFVMLLLAARRTADARDELLALATRPDGAAVANRLLALLDFDAGDYDAASTRFTELLSGGRDVEEAFYYLGLIAERHADFDRALRLYARVESGENLLPSMLRAAAILHAHGEAPAAAQLMARLAEDQPEHAPEILSANARFYADAGDLPEALRLLDLAIERYPDDVDLRFTRASWYDEAGQVDASLGELRRILQSRPADPAAMNALGYTLADHSRQLRRARILIERAYSAAPKNAAICDSMGWVLYREGRVGDALPFLVDAYAEEHGADIAAHLGEVLWQLGKRDEAERTWAQADVRDPGNRLLKATRNRLHAER